MAKAERGGDQMEPVQTGCLVSPSSSSSLCLLLEEQVEVGSQAAAHPAPLLAAEPPDDRRALTQGWREYGAIARPDLLVVVV